MLKQKLRPLSVTTVMEIDAEMRSLIAPINVQIDSPQRLEPTLLSPFQQQHEQIFLLITREGQLLSAVVESIQETFMIVHILEETGYAKPGERVLAFFPVLPDQYYVLQAWIEEADAAQLTLRYQDPRYEVRRSFQLNTQPALYLAPPMVISVMEQRRVRLLREMCIDPRSLSEGHEGYITDYLCKTSSLEPSPHMKLFQEYPAITGSLQNISCGGMCIALAQEDKPEKLLYRVVLLQITLPHLLANLNGQDHPSIKLKLLGNIRGVATTEQQWTLHISFLRRLPREFDKLLAYLERRFLDTQRPL